MNDLNNPFLGLLNGKLVSVDIETTGLDPEDSDILEVAAIVFHLDPGNVGVESFHCFLKHDVIRWNEDTFNFHMKNGYFDYAKSEKLKSVPRMDTESFERALVSFLAVNDVYDVSKPRGGSATAVGKNFGSFDLQFLNKLNYGSLKKRRLFKHRALDIGNLLWNPISDGTTLPSSEQCAERMGLSGAGITHRAMDDADMMVQLTRLAVGKWLKKNAMSDAALTDAAKT